MKIWEKYLELSEEQVLFFRARRGHLAGGGAATPAQCAKEMLGLQSQQLAPGLLALSQCLDFELHPLGGWVDKKHLKGFVEETKAVAGHLELEHGEIQ